MLPNKLLQKSASLKFAKRTMCVHTCTACKVCFEVQERQIEDLEQFIQRARRYTDITELTPYALRELVKAVYVEAPDKSSGKRKQRVHIEYDLVGYIPVDELIKAEQA